MQTFRNLHSAVIKIITVLLCRLFLIGSLANLSNAEPIGWLNWRGPERNGASKEAGLVDIVEVDGKNHLWSYELSGRGTPVVSGNRVYALGYRGKGPDLQEILVCLDSESGKALWQLGFNDFLSDVIYERYSIGSPAVDTETGNVYILTSPGILACVSPSGEILWNVSMMEEYGRLTFPNGRTGSPVVEGDLVIVNAITCNWGAEGPARNRFYAFQKKTGELVWSSTPGETPKDSSFSTPVLAWSDGKRVFYCGTGCGNVVCINARTGDPIWRFKMSKGGVNSSVVLDRKDRLIAIHGQENVDSSETGRMVAIRLDAKPTASEEGAPVLGPEAEIWRNPLCMFTSSPVIVNDRVYQLVDTGKLSCVDAETGKILWEKKLADSQLHASPLYADGKLYVPMLDGALYILRPSDEGAETLCSVKLEGNCLGSPCVWDGRIYVHTTSKLYCFGSGQGSKLDTPAEPLVRTPDVGEATRLQALPSEVLMHPGDRLSVDVFGLDANGNRTGRMTDVTWKKFIPPTAKVKSEMDAAFDPSGELVAPENARLSAGAFQVTNGAGLVGTIRGRIFPVCP